MTNNTSCVLLCRTPLQDNYWPPESPVAQVYDIRNTSSSMILLNNRMENVCTAICAALIIVSIAYHSKASFSAALAFQLRNKIHLNLGGIVDTTPCLNH